MRRHALVWVLVLGVTAAAGLGLWALRSIPVAGWRPPPDGALETLGDYGEVPDFALTDQHGRLVTRIDLRGLVWVANFIYSRCTETCPLQSARLARLQSEFTGAERLRLVSITVDPEHDTPAVLARYAERYRADPVRWLFLTGERRTIYRLARDGFRLGVVDPDDAAAGPPRWAGPRPAWAAHGSKGLVIHSARLVLVDPRSRIRAYHLPEDENSFDRLRQNLRALLAAVPGPPPQPSS